MDGGKCLRRVGGALGVALRRAPLWGGGAQADTASFAFTGAEQTFTVPAGVSSMHVVAIGAPGGTGAGNAMFGGALGGIVQAEVTVSPGQMLFIEVGGAGGNGLSVAGGAGG